MAEIWKYFEKLPEDREKARCRKCLQILSCKGSSTSGLLRHMKNKHDLDLKPSPETSVAKVSSVAVPVKQESMLKFVKRQSLAEIVARLVAKDGFSINGVTKSEFIRESISKRGYSLPTSKTSVMKLVSEFYEYAKQQTQQDILSRIERGELPSITFDEWTSLSNKRYLNVNAHFGDGSFYNLGLCKINGSLPAERMLEMVGNKVQLFGMKVELIVAATTDGARVMLKFGRLSDYIHQQCYNHAIHLAVCDVLYKDPPPSSTNADASDDDDSDADPEEGDDQDLEHGYFLSG